MVASIVRKTTIMHDQNMMTLFIVLDSKLVSKEVNEYFMFRKREELGKIQARLQPTTTILANVSPPKEILDLTTPHGDSHEDEDSLAFDSSPAHLCKEDHNSQNSPYVGRFLETFNVP
jgi:hypothetical protein